MLETQHFSGDLPANQLACQVAQKGGGATQGQPSGYKSQAQHRRAQRVLHKGLRLFLLSCGYRFFPGYSAQALPADSAKSSCRSYVVKRCKVVVCKTANTPSGLSQGFEFLVTQRN